MNKILLNTLLNKEKNKVPIWLMRQAGRYLPEYKEVRKKAGSFLNLCYNPKLATKVTLQPIERFGFDGAILFSDILVIPDALGQKLDFKENEGPILDKINNIEKLNKILNLDFDNFHNHLNPVYETLDILKTKLNKQTTLIGFAGSPFTVASYMIMGKGKVNYKEFAKWGNLNSEFFNKIIDILIDFTASYLIKQIEVGAQVIQIFDSWAGQLENDDFLKWSIIPNQKIIEKVKKVFPNTPIIGFPRGAGKNIIPFVKKTKINAVSIENGLNLKWVNENIQSLCVIQGCLDNKTLLTGNNLESETIKILDEFTNNKNGFIFNLGHGIIKETPIKNVEKLVNIIRNYK